MVLISYVVENGTVFWKSKGSAGRDGSLPESVGSMGVCLPATLPDRGLVRGPLARRNVYCLGNGL